MHAWAGPSPRGPGPHHTYKDEEAEVRGNRKTRLARTGATATACLVATGIVALLLLSACSNSSEPTQEHGTSGAGGDYQAYPAAAPKPNTKLPADVEASPELRELYVFAMEHPEILTEIPCTCGCMEGAGHYSNWNCYIHSIAPDGTVSFDSHAPG